MRTSVEEHASNESSVDTARMARLIACLNVHRTRAFMQLTMRRDADFLNCIVDGASRAGEALM